LSAQAKKDPKMPLVVLKVSMTMARMQMVPKDLVHQSKLDQISAQTTL